jgi:hypothetical protein
LIPAWLRGYDRGWLPADAIAGLTVWALMVPQALAYAGIAGVPVQNGLYVMPLAVVGYVLLGSSRHLYVGPSATVATLSASTVALVAAGSTGSADYIALTCALTLMVGVIYIAGGLARMGFVARFFARPGARGLHRRARPLHRHRPAAEGGGHREAVGQHALGARAYDRRRRELGMDHGRRRRSRGWSRCSRSHDSRRSSRA